MIIKHFLTALLLFSYVSLFSDQTDDIKKENLELKDKYYHSLEIWESKKTSNYYLKIKYSAFSPISGIYEIYVKNNKIIKWIFNDNINPKDMMEVVSGFTMDNLYKIAKGSLTSKKTDDFILLVTYENKTNFIKSITRIKNPETKNNVPNDKTYKYEILNLNIF